MVGGDEEEEGEGGGGGVLPEEEDQPHLLPHASLLGRLAVLKPPNPNMCKDRDANLGDWIGLLEELEPGELLEEGAHSKKSLQVLGANHCQIRCDLI